MHNNHLKNQFLLRKDITFLNFGSFGACPKPILDEYHRLQYEMEEEPVQFIVNNGLQYLKQSREALGKFINCDADDVVYVTNPSYAVNAIAKSLQLNAGDEVLTTDIEYGACDKTWQYYCDKVGAKYVQSKVQFPIENKIQFVNNFFKDVSPKTKLIFISHITSSTALRLPVEEICMRARQLEIATFVDGAHAPGQIPLDMKDLDVDYYTGACHKWMMTPKGSSFLYTKKEKQAALDPLIISWGYKALFPSHSMYLDYHQMNGTRDYTAFLCIPKAIAFMQEHNWSEIAAACRSIVQSNAARHLELCGSKALAPINDDFICQMYAAEIKTDNPEKLYFHIFEKYKIEIPVMRHGNKVFLRYSINAFNNQEDLDHLFDALVEIRREGWISM